jgi:hypothetical protein
MGERPDVRTRMGGEHHADATIAVDMDPLSLLCRLATQDPKEGKGQDCEGNPIRRTRSE